jgi:hypothetical protein
VAINNNTGGGTYKEGNTNIGLAEWAKGQTIWQECRFMRNSNTACKRIHSNSTSGLQENIILKLGVKKHIIKWQGLNWLGLFLNHLADYQLLKSDFAPRSLPTGR